MPDRILAVPNFSSPIPPVVDRLYPTVRVHYRKGDVDHGRSVVALSGDPDQVDFTLRDLVWEYLPTLDLQNQTGVHPRIGALDVAPFVDLEGHAAARIAEEFAFFLYDTMGVPTVPYERNAPPGAESALPKLRRGEVRGNPRYGITIYGARGFLIAANLDFPAELRTQVANAAREIRRRRDAGDPALAGVRALAFDLRSRGEVQLSFNLTRPDETSFDSVAAIGEELVGARANGTELIGVIRPRDLPGATRLEIAPEQVV